MAKIIEQRVEERLPGAGGRGVGGQGAGNGAAFQFCRMKTVLETDGSDGGDGRVAM